MSAEAPIHVNHNLLKEGIKKFTTHPNYMVDGKGPANYLPLVFEGYNCMGSAYMDFDSKSGKGHVGTRWNEDRFPDATSFSILFTVDDEAKKIFLQDEHVTAWRTIGSEHYYLKYQLDPEHPQMCTLSEIRFQTESKQKGTIQREYVLVSEEEKQRLIAQLHEENFPTEVNWVQTMARFFQDPVGEFHRNPDQPFAE